MPYSPVPPALRRRSRQACDACRAARKKCDAKLPCFNCDRKGVASKCSYASVCTKPPTPSTSTPGRSVEHRPQDDHPPATAERDTRGAALNSREGSPPIAQDPRMLLNATGEKVFVGASASISFLQFLRQFLRRYAGPSAFTESQKRHTMLEVAMPRQDLVVFSDDVDLATKASLIDSFFYATNGFLHIFTRQDAQRLLQAISAGERVNDRSIPIHQQDQLAVLYLMIAIGARCRWRYEVDTQCSSYFTEAQRIVFGTMLHDPSFGMVVSFVFMAFYMCCACRRNTAVLYLGIALRAATVLGLHQAHLDPTLDPEIRELRVRTWKSLSVIDLYCNAILGRPSNTFDNLCQPIGRDVEASSPTHSMRALDANFRLCFIIEAISLRLLCNTVLELDTAEDFLQQLRAWVQTLPDDLRLSLNKEESGMSENTDREMSVGNVHVACSYYFGVILTTRQFLVTTITSQIRRQTHRKSGSQELGNQPRGTPESKPVQLASVCGKAATYMVEMCHEAASWDRLLNNMCILQAWIFASGLILGFCRLSQDTIWPSEVYGASIMACSVLEKLSKASPQAQRYHEILLQFLNAVESYKNNISERQADDASQYLERILRPRTGAAWEETGNLITIATPPPTLTPSEDHVEGPLVERPFDEFLWNQPGALAPQVSDDLGFQMLWEQLTPELSVPEGVMNGVAHFSGESFTQSSWDYGGS